MKLVGLLDSPFVRRTFISARMLGIPFEHQSLSVFRNLAEFHAINPLLKAPTLVLDDGELMVDSTQIITWFERIAPAGKIEAIRLSNRRAADAQGHFNHYTPGERAKLLKGKSV